MTHKKSTTSHSPILHPIKPHNKSDPPKEWPYFNASAWFSNKPFDTQVFNRMTESTLELQQKWMEESVEWMKWQQATYHQNMENATRGWVHSLQLSSEPNKWYRYMRMNWQKPFIQGAAQALSANRLLFGFCIDNWNAYQQCWVGKEEKH